MNNFAEGNSSTNEAQIEIKTTRATNPSRTSQPGTRDRRFSMPKRGGIYGRASSITNSFVNGIIPVVVPTSEQIDEALSILGMNEDILCAYCGDTASEWDHLRPLVVDKKPTGFISEIANLVPACGKCNQSKGNKPWREWIVSNSRLSPRTRGINNLDARVGRLTAYESWAEPKRINFESVAGEQLWQQHWDNHKDILAAMKSADSVAFEIRERLAKLF